MRQRRTCDWCNKETYHCRRTPDRSGWECQKEKTCGSSRTQGVLTRLGLERVLECVERHSWNLAAVARELGVHFTAPLHYLQRKAPALLTAARAAGKRVRQGGSNPKLTDAARVAKTMHRYNGSIKATAAALEVNRITLQKALKRLVPELYQRLPELRRTA